MCGWGCFTLHPAATTKCDENQFILQERRREKTKRAREEEEDWRKSKGAPPQGCDGPDPLPCLLQASVPPSLVRLFQSLVLEPQILSCSFKIRKSWCMRSSSVVYRRTCCIPHLIIVEEDLGGFGPWFFPSSWGVFHVKIWCLFVDAWCCPETYSYHKTLGWGVSCLLSNIFCLHICCCICFLPC